MKKMFICFFALFLMAPLEEAFAETMAAGKENASLTSIMKKKKKKKSGKKGKTKPPKIKH
jgi:hypothetical protein